MGDNTEFIVSKDKLESFLPTIGAELTEDGYIRDIQTGKIFKSDEGEKINVDNIGYLGYDEEQGIIPVEDNFSDIVSHLSDRDFRD